MKKIVFILIVFSFIATALIMSCGKQIPNGGAIPPFSLLQSWISDGPWQLISYTRYNNNGTAISKYQGTSKDTLQFGYTADANQNVVRTGAGFYIRGIYTVCPYQLPWDSTIITGPSCRSGYNDTLRLNFFSENLLVFRVQFDSANIHCWELDSLKKMYFTNP